MGLFFLYVYNMRWMKQIWYSQGKIFIWANIIQPNEEVKEKKNHSEILIIFESYKVSNKNTQFIVHNSKSIEQNVCIPIDDKDLVLHFYFFSVLFGDSQNPYNFHDSNGCTIETVPYKWKCNTLNLSTPIIVIMLGTEKKRFYAHAFILEWKTLKQFHNNYIVWSQCISSDEFIL